MSVTHALINGKVRRYDISARVRDAHDRRMEQCGNWIWLGKGTIVKIGGKKNVFTEKLNFWRSSRIQKRVGHSERSRRVGAGKQRQK